MFLTAAPSWITDLFSHLYSSGYLPASDYCAPRSSKWTNEALNEEMLAKLRAFCYDATRSGIGSYTLHTATEKDVSDIFIKALD
jgi:hypothetical protein